VRTLDVMRVAIVTESFEPTINGVSGSIRHVLAELAALGHEALVIAPGRGPAESAGFPVVRLPAMPAPAVYRSFPIGLPLVRRIEAVLRDFRPDVVHLASPVLMGGAGALAARRVGVPSVAVFQTDLASFARHYHLGWTGPALWSWLRHLHELADSTLVPSSATYDALACRGFPRLTIWPRGVDLEQFAPERRSRVLRSVLGGSEALLVGYVGRVAVEKRVDLLPAVAGLDGVRLVVVGTGPAHPWLRRHTLGSAHLGWRSGADLGRAVASLDVLVRPGADETFCQTVQEALAAGVPVVAAAAGGPLDLVRNGVNGVLVAPGSATALGRAVESLVRARSCGRGWPAAPARRWSIAPRPQSRRAWSSTFGPSSADRPVGTSSADRPPNGTQPEPAAATARSRLAERFSERCVPRLGPTFVARGDCRSSRAHCV